MNRFFAFLISFVLLAVVADAAHPESVVAPIPASQQVARQKAKSAPTPQIPGIRFELEPKPAEEGGPGPTDVAGNQPEDLNVAPGGRPATAASGIRFELEPKPADEGEPGPTDVAGNPPEDLNLVPGGRPATAASGIRFELEPKPADEGEPGPTDVAGNPPDDLNLVPGGQPATAASGIRFELEPKPSDEQDPSATDAAAPPDDTLGGVNFDTFTNSTVTGPVRPMSSAAAFDPVSSPESFDYVENGRNPAIQLMIVVKLVVTVGGSPPVPEVVPPPLPEKPGLWSAIRRVFAFNGGLDVSVAGLGPSRPALSAYRVGSLTGTSLAPVQPRSSSRSQSGSNPIQMFLTNVGNSTGEAFTAHIFNNSDQDVDFSFEGLVVEPLKQEAKQRVQQQLSQLMSKNPLTAQLDAYCLEFLRAPPSVDTMFQIAPKALQDQFVPMRNILSASQQLQDLSLLPPDSDLTNYFHSIRQWAMWTTEEGFDLGSFADSFVEHTKRQIEQAGQQWTSQFDQVLRGAAPARWANIQRILQTAGVQ